MQLELERLDPDKVLSSLKGEWNGLLDRSPERTVYLTWEWMSSWWRHYGKGSDPMLLLCRDRQTGRLIGIAPLLISPVRSLGTFPIRRLGFMGTGEVCSDFLDFIIESGHEDTVLQAVFGYLERHARSWDILSLTNIPEASPNLPLIRKWADQGGYSYIQREHTLCPHIKWRDGWESYLSSRSRSHRRHHRKQIQRLQERGKVELMLVEDREQHRLAMDRFRAFHQRRWRERGQPGSFSSARFGRFHNDVSLEFLSRGWLDLSELRVGGQTVAIRYAFRYNGTVFGYLPAFDIDWAPYGVGSTALAMCIEKAMREGRAFNLSRGTSPHKMHWATGVDRNLTVEVGGRHKRARFARRIADLDAGARKRMRKLLPETLTRALKRLGGAGLEDE